MNEESLYEKVLAEVEANQIKKGLWAKAYAHSSGSTESTKKRYIQLRVQQLQDEAARKAARSRRRSGCLLWFVLLFLVLLLIGGAGSKDHESSNVKASFGNAQPSRVLDQRQAAAENKEPELHDPILVDTTQPPVYIELPPYVKNLDPAEGECFVQAKIVLQMAPGSKYSAMIEGRKPQINNIINRILTSKKPSDIRTASGQEALSQEILTAINDALGYVRPAQPTGPWGPVIAVLFNSLIIIQ